MTKSPKSPVSSEAPKKRYAYVSDSKSDVLVLRLMEVLREEEAYLGRIRLVRKALAMLDMDNVRVVVG